MEESPLHAFELHNLIPLVPAGIDISINKAVILMWIVVGLVAVVMISASAGRKLVPGKLQNIAELIVEFIRGIILDTMGEPGMKYFPLIATLFLFILFANLLGLIPGSYTVTSQIIVTAVFAVGIYGLSLVLGFALHGAKFLGILVPPRHAGLAAAADDSHRIDQSAGTSDFAGCAVVCEHDGRPRDSRGAVRVGDQRRIAHWVAAVRLHDCHEWP